MGRVVLVTFPRLARLLHVFCSIFLLLSIELVLWGKVCRLSDMCTLLTLRSHTAFLCVGHSAWLLMALLYFLL